MAAPSSPAGWYPDPSGHGQRYFDGISWTEHRAVPPAAPSAPAVSQRRFTIHYGFGLLAVFSLLGTILPAGLMFFANVGNPETSGAGTTMGVLWLLWGGFWTLIWTAFAIQHTLRARRD